MVSSANVTIENFDDLFTGNPIDIEKNLKSLLPQAQKLQDKSCYLQIMSQIALAQAMQQNFDLAHKTLDAAEKALEPHYHLAKVRILLERARVFHQSDKIEAALPLFIESYELSLEHGFDFHTINAAHMIAIVVKLVDEKITWNKKVIDLATKTEDKRAQKWLGALYNNLAQNYLEIQSYQEALQSFENCKKHAEEQGDFIVMRGAKWGVARCLRSMGSLNEALEIQTALLKEYEQIVKKGELPPEVIEVSRGVVFEELAELHLAKAKEYAALAYQDLAKNLWCNRLMPERLEKMKLLQEWD